MRRRGRAGEANTPENAYAWCVSVCVCVYCPVPVRGLCRGARKRVLRASSVRACRVQACISAGRFSTLCAPRFSRTSSRYRGHGRRASSLTEFATSNRHACTLRLIAKSTELPLGPHDATNCLFCCVSSSSRLRPNAMPMMARVMPKSTGDAAVVGAMKPPAQNSRVKRVKHVAFVLVSIASAVPTVIFPFVFNTVNIAEVRVARPERPERPLYPYHSVVFGVTSLTSAHRLPTCMAFFWCCVQCDSPCAEACGNLRQRGAGCPPDHAERHYRRREVSPAVLVVRQGRATHPRCRTCEASNRSRWLS